MDYYSTLGVAKTATPDEIKKAYRKLASQHHPDKGGDTATFQKVEEAYRTLSDPEKRQEYDNPIKPNMGGFNFNPNGGGFNPFEDIIQEFMRRGQQPQKPTYRTNLAYTLEEAYSGAEKLVQLNTQQGLQPVKIKVQLGLHDNSTIRYDNIIPNANLLIDFHQIPNLKYERRGNDLYSEIAVNVLELIVGTSIEFTTISGKTFEISIKPKTNPNGMIRMQGQGMPIYNRPNMFGDQILLIKPVMPDTIDNAITESILQSLKK